MQTENTGMVQTLDQALDELVIANHILASEGVLDGFGHVSIRAPDDPTCYFLPRARAPELVDRADLIRFTLESSPVEASPTLGFYSERVIHGEIYKARPDVLAICHNHAEAIMPFCLTETPLLPVFHLGGAAIGDAVPVWDSRDEFGDTNMLVAKPVQGASLARALGSRFIVLMRRHGSTVAGLTLREMTFRCVYMIANARMQLAAAQLGTFQTLSPGEVELTAQFNLHPSGINRSWDRWAARVSR